MTPRQQRFVAEFAIDGNATQAAIRAGYSPNGAKVTASRLLTKPNVAAAVSERTQRVLERAEITAADIARVAWEIATDAETQPGARVSALALLAKRHPEFSDKHEHSGPAGGPIPVEVAAILAEMGPERVAAWLAQRQT